MTIRQLISFIILITAISSSMVLLNGCGKRVATSRLSESREADVAGGEKVEAPSVERVVSAEPMPVIDEPGEGELKDTSAEDTSAKGTGAKDQTSKGLAKLINDVYFDFDKFLIREDAKKTLNKNAAVLTEKKIKKIVIEGHCDERGTSDYNLALGERRAEAVKRYLTNLGVSKTNISTISFGKEKPFCKEHNEACWQQNRSGHFVVTE